MIRRNFNSPIIIKRPIFILAAAMLIGIVAAAFCSKILMHVFLLLIACAATACFALGRKKNLYGKKKSVFCRSARNLRWVCVLAAAAFSLGFLLFSSSVSSFEEELLPTIRASVAGKVSAVTQRESVTYLEVEHCTLDSVTLKTELKGKTVFQIYGRQEIAVGDYILGVGVVYSKPFEYDGKIDGYSIAENIKYTMQVDRFETIAGEKDFFEQLRQDLRGLLSRHMSENAASISYAVLVGDTSDMQKSVVQGYRDIGLGHIFAVSGLHVGLLCGVLLFMLKPFCKNAWVCFCLLFCALLFYNFFCGFSPSILRSSIMFLCFLLSSVFGERHDSLTALSVACIINILLQPLIVFYVGFMLSFSVVFCIIILQKPFKRLFSFLPSFLSKPLSGAVAAQVGILPLQLIYFGQFPIYSLAANLIGIPVFTVVYILLFLFVFLSLIFPQVLIVPGWCFDQMTSAALFVSKLPFANVAVAAVGLFPLFYYAIAFFISHYKKLKSGVCLTVAALYAIGILLQTVVTLPQKDSITLESPYYAESVKFCFQGKEYVLSQKEQSEGVDLLKDKEEVFGLSVGKLLVLYGLNRARFNIVLETFNEHDYIVSDRYLSELRAIYYPDLLLSFQEIPYFPYTNYYSAQRHGKKTFYLAHFET